MGRQEDSKRKIVKEILILLARYKIRSAARKNRWLELKKMIKEDPSLKDLIKRYEKEACGDKV